ncbi:MAG: hypothetical protein ACYSW3_00465 [Planctomycetota bacterium]
MTNEIILYSSKHGTSFLGRLCLVGQLLIWIFIALIDGEVVLEFDPETGKWEYGG